MAIDDPLAPMTQPLSPSMQTQVSVQATAPSASQAAAAVQDITGGGWLGLTATAFAKYPLDLIRLVSFALIWVGAVLTFLIVAGVEGNDRAYKDTSMIFSNGYVWIVVGGVLLGSAWLYSQPSPVKP